MIERGFAREALTGEEIGELTKRANLCRGDILKMTTLAASGHPGGSMSTIDMMVLVHALADIDPRDPCKADRDYVVVSHGHISPCTYSSLARTGFCDIDQAIAGFRLVGSPFEGHVEHLVPGVEWNTGNLGQGLSAACGLALNHRIKGHDGHCFVFSGDGEHAKGQISEARRFASKYKLKDITMLVDYNELQISGSIHDVMPQAISEGYRADGWHVIETDGHDLAKLYAALREAVNHELPTMILGKTIMGKGVSFMENKHGYHGAPIKPDQLGPALKELGLENDIEKYKDLRASYTPPAPEHMTCPVDFTFKVDAGAPRVYGAEDKVDNRSAFGNALFDIAEATAKKSDPSPFAVFDCDLASSVKTSKFANAFPDNFFQVGIQEHNAATMAGALSTKGVVTFFADFGVFGVDETYNQQRLNDINWANIKVACTHVGIDVGEDGKTHHCLDYVGAMRNIFGFHVVVPGDPNQTDRAMRHIAGQAGCWLLAMGRSKIPTITCEDGTPFYGKDYVFEYGRADWIREGKDGVIAAMGAAMPRAMEAQAMLAEEGIQVGLLNVSCPKKLDSDAMEMAAATGLIVTVEDHNILTGLGSCLADYICEAGLSTRLVKMGVTHYAPSGNSNALFEHLGLSAGHIAATVREALGR